MRIIILIASMLSTTTALASVWDNLWLTPDQQGKRFMQKGNYTKALEKFENQGWSATAHYRAGKYEEAAKQFEALESEQGYYNQGNALAHLGQYEKAIASYDKALKLNPNNQDALYNRQLLKDLMKKDKEKKQNQDKQSQQNKDSNKDKQDKQNKDKQNKDQKDKSKTDNNKQNKDQKDKDQQDKDKQKDQTKDKKNKDNLNKDKDQQDKNKQDKDKQNKDKQNKEKQDKEKQNKAQPKPSDKQQTADKEKDKAKQQWLQLVPDDPGGLLREKFLRDHLRRERGWTQ